VKLRPYNVTAKKIEPLDGLQSPGPILQPGAVNFRYFKMILSHGLVNDLDIKIYQGWHKTYLPWGKLNAANADAPAIKVTIEWIRFEKN